MYNNGEFTMRSLTSCRRPHAILDETNDAESGWYAKSSTPRRRMFAAILTSGVLAVVAAPLLAQPTAEEILSRLSGPIPVIDWAEPADAGGPIARGLGIGNKAKPNPATNVCEDNGQAAPNVSSKDTRSLYVEQAPAIDLDIAFDHNSAELRPEGRRTLDALATVIRDPSLAGDKFVVAGHTNKVGEDEYNQRLSCARAIAVRSYLQVRGVAGSRLVAMGFGFKRLKNVDTPAADENRRVEIRKSGG